MRIAVLMTCHNRKEMTLRCLASLLGQEKVEVRGGGGERRDEPQMTSSCAEFRPTRFAFDPAHTRDGKRELADDSTSRHDIANSASAVGCIRPGVGRTQFAKSACREATCCEEFRDRVEVEGGGGEWPVDVFLVDDGCTDGTVEAVKELGDEVVVGGGGGEQVEVRGGGGEWKIHIIQGSGEDYWAKGMERAWRAALIHSTTTTFNYDCCLWLNDDTVLDAGAIAKFWHCHADNPDAVINGTLVNAKGEEVYGYNVRNAGLAGNCVLVPRAVYEKVGMICGAFAHGWADRDYGLRVEKAGFRIVSAGVVGRAEWHEMRPSLAGRGLRERLRLLWDPKGWNVHDLWLLRVRNWGVCAAIWSCAHLICHVIFGERGRSC